MNVRLSANRLVRLIGVFAIAAFTLLIASSSGAGAQDEDATLDITVRYPDGSLVTDSDICYSFWTYSENGDRAGFAGSNSIPGGADRSLAVDSGGRYSFEVHGCTGGAGDPIARTWHTGIPSFGTGSEAIAARDAIVAVPGSNAVEVTVARSTISGTVVHESADRCRGTVWGKHAYSEYEGPVAQITIEDDGSYEALVAPGSYRVEVSCFLRSAYEAWPNKAKAGEADLVAVGHNQTRSGINFDLNDRFNESTGAGISLTFDSPDAYEIPKCIQAYDAVGTLVVEWASDNYVAVANNGNYRIRVSDCFDMGITTVWYRSSLTQSAGQLIVVDGEFFEIPLDSMQILAAEYSACNDQDVTIRGSGGDDELFGTAGDDVISGLGGNDTIRGLGGNDIICGGDGNDRIFGNAGLDWIDAGAGNDWVGAGWGDDTVFGGAGDDFIRGFKHNDWVDGGTGNDRITGGWGNDVLRGGAGNDVLRAYYGADQLFGDAGNDVLLGGFGPDFLVGGPGPLDRLFGQEGTKDVCNDVGVDAMFSGCETINGN